MRFNSLFDSKFRGCEQIGHLNNEATGQHLRVYKLAAYEDLVGVNDGASCWVCNPKYGLFNMKQGVSKDHPESSPVRKRINIQGTTTGRISGRVKLLPSTTVSTEPVVRVRRRLHETN